MYAENKFPNIIVYIDDDETINTFDEFLAGVFNSAPDSIEFVNEGFEIALGNAYAVYEFTAFNQTDGIPYVFTYVLRHEDWGKLLKDKQLELEPYIWNELKDMPNWLRPEWAA